MSEINLLNPPCPPGQKYSIEWGQLYGTALSLTLNAFIEKCQTPVLIITADTLSALRLEFEINFFNQQKNTILHFPDWETLPYDHFSPHQDIISGRLAALYKIPRLKQGAIITPISTLMYQLCPTAFVDGNYFLLKVGDTLDLEITRQRLEIAGYRNTPEVNEHGEFTIRGSIIDLFPMGSDTPFRIDLFDNEIDTIRTFAPDTQRTIEKIDKIEILPAKEFSLSKQSIEHFRHAFREQFGGNPLNCALYQDISNHIATPGIEYYLPLFFDHTATLFDYLPKNTVIINVGNHNEKAEEFWQEINLRFKQYSGDRTRPLLLPQQVFVTYDEIKSLSNNYSNIKILTEKNNHNFINIPPPILPIDYKTENPVFLVKNFINEYSGRILFAAETAGRREVLLQLFHSHQIYPKNFSSWDEFLKDNERIGIIVAALDDGVMLTAPEIALIAETQLFGKRIMQRRRRKETTDDAENLIKDLQELQIGAPIVHIDHGVGRYLGLKTLEIGGQIGEFLHIEYANEDKLYVPVAYLHLISRYSGIDPEHAPLNKLGTDNWSRAKKKAAEQVTDVAAELLDIYAKREAEVGFAFKNLNTDYQAFAESFPFEETPDQLKAINDVIHDMSQEKPMDRLICGDVGFGKTEVAMRAAFLAVQNGRQVVVLVPTTLLAQQHFNSFQDRFAAWPFTVAVLSRFQSGKDQDKKILALQEGKVDIIIGTHKLLQEEIKFKNLGLIIIDEEHRFGVKQKERLKSLRINAHILTLTATPIPRTLNMAFSGIRDLSLIATPPAKRLSIKTFVHENQNTIIQEAIVREIMRGGQVYFLHNDVASIERQSAEISKLVPEARVGVAHGQMRERELEQVMSDFYHRRFNVLVCTTIIESGIDIPSANTIIIHRADKFGLSQLHQLRGRVGRSHHQAYAYLLIPSWKTITSDAVKRLEAISSLEDLGIGFTLATHDLEIRGAGELLGEDQSGNMQAVGFTLYMDLLNNAVKALKAGLKPDLDLNKKTGAEIDLHIPAMIPENYLGDIGLRLQFYKRIAVTKTERDLDEIQVEMIDRFGLLPEFTKNLFGIHLIRQRAENLGIIKIDANKNGGRIDFNDKPNIDPMKIIKLIQNQSKNFRLEGSTRLKFIWEESDIKVRIDKVNEILGLL